MTVSGTLLPYPLLQFLPPQPWLSSFFSATLPLLPTMPSQDLANVAWAATVWQGLAAKASSAAEEGTVAGRSAAVAVHAAAEAEAEIGRPEHRPFSREIDETSSSPPPLSPHQGSKHHGGQQLVSFHGGSDDSDEDAPAAPPAQSPPLLRLDSSLGSDSDEDAPVAQRWWSSPSGRSAQATAVPRLMAPPADLIQHPASPHQNSQKEDSLKQPLSPPPPSSVVAVAFGGSPSAIDQPLQPPSSAIVSVSSPAGVSATTIIPRRWQLQLLSQFEERIAASPLTRLTADSALHQPQQQQAGRIPSSSSPGLRPTLFSSPSSITPGRAVGAAALHFQPQALATLCWCIGQLRLLPAPWVPELLLQAG